MSGTITINKDTPTDELVTVMELLLAWLIDRVGIGMVVGMLFGTAVLMTIDDAERHA